MASSSRRRTLLLWCAAAAAAHAHAAAPLRPRSASGLHSGAVAAAHRASVRAERAAHPPPDVLLGGACPWQRASSGYWEACGGAAGDLGSFSSLTPAAAEAACCANASCAGFSFHCDDGECLTTGSGYYKANLDCGFVSAAGFLGFAKPSRLPVLPNVSLAVSPAGPLQGDMAVVNVSFAFLTGAMNKTTDWVGQTCAGAPIEDYIEFSPVDFMQLQGSSGWLTFPVFRSRCDFTFSYFRGKQPLWPSGAALAQSARITWAGSWADAPFHTHVAFGGEDAQHSMVISFSTNSTPGGGGVLVQLGTAPGVYSLPNATDAESTTYGAGDLCNAPANTTSVDFWQWPGVFHHVTARGLAPGTRYYARPVAGGVPGDEVTFVTGKALGPDVPVTFASYGDMSVTQYVLDGDSGKDMPDGGPGAVGTARRLRDRIDGANDIDFVTHYGDLGYAKGAIFLWDSWMAMMAHVGSRVPYMVSVGKCVFAGRCCCVRARRATAPLPFFHSRRSHEYDYRFASPNDPSGVSSMWRPSWWDGDVDSLGECGVGTQQRFRSPRNGNGIFWYSFAVGSVTVVTLSSEHDLSPDSPQGEFLARELAAVNRSVTPWLIVSLHRMMYSLTVRRGMGRRIATTLPHTTNPTLQTSPIPPFSGQRAGAAGRVPRAVGRCLLPRARIPGDDGTRAQFATNVRGLQL